MPGSIRYKKIYNSLSHSIMYYVRRTLFLLGEQESVRVLDDQVVGVYVTCNLTANVA